MKINVGSMMTSNFIIQQEINSLMIYLSTIARLNDKTQKETRESSKICERKMKID